MDIDGIHHRDHELTARCLSGDPSAQRALFESQRARVKSTFGRILGRSAEIDDLLQEVFVRVFRSLPRFRAEALLATWIDRIAVRVAFAHLRKNRARERIEIVHDSLDEAGCGHPWSTEQIPLEREAVRRLLAVLDSLESTQCRAFLLHAVEGKSALQVAAQMGSSLPAAKARIFRARRTLVQRAGRDPVIAEYVTGRSASSRRVSRLHAARAAVHVEKVQRAPPILAPASRLRHEHPRYPTNPTGSAESAKWPIAKHR